MSTQQQVCEPHHNNISYGLCKLPTLKQFDIPTHGFDKTLTKLVSEHFTPSCDESQKFDYLCSNSKNGCQEEFLALKAHEKSCIYQKVPCPSVSCKEVITFKDVDNHMEQNHKKTA